MSSLALASAGGVRAALAAPALVGGLMLLRPSAA